MVTVLGTGSGCRSGSWMICSQTAVRRPKSNVGIGFVIGKFREISVPPAVKYSPREIIGVDNGLLFLFFRNLRSSISVLFSNKLIVDAAFNPWCFRNTWNRCGRSISSFNKCGWANRVNHMLSWLFLRCSSGNKCPLWFDKEFKIEFSTFQVICGTLEGLSTGISTFVQIFKGLVKLS